MAKPHTSREDFWAKVEALVADFQDKKDDASVFLAKLAEVRDEPTHEV